MAFIKKDGNFMGLPMNIKRSNPIPLDDSSIYYSLQDAQTYAKTGATAYVGQIIQVVDEANGTATAYIIKNPAGDLEEIGSGGSSTIVVATKADLNDSEKVAEDLAVGQVAYVSDEHTSYILESIGDAPPTSYVWSEMVSSDTVWAETENPVIFYALTQSAYDTKAGSPDANFNNTLFFVTDTGRVYKGATDVSNSILVVDSIPEVSVAVKNKLYLHKTTYEAKITVDGTTWIDMSPGYLTDGANWAETSNNGKLATIGLIKKGIQAAIDAIEYTVSFTGTTGEVSVNGGTAATLTGVAHGVKYDSEQMKLTIPVYGQDSPIEVNIPKDTFIQSGSYDEDTNEIVLVTNTGTEIRIPASGLVDVYTGGTTDTLTVTVENNEIKGTVKIDTADTHLTSSAAGLKVDVSDKINTYGAGNNAEIIISDAAGTTIARSGASILLDPDNEAVLGTSQTQVPVASVIARAISAAVQTAQEEIQTLLDSKVDKVVGIENNFVQFSANGAIKDGGIKAGGATFEETPSETTLATEKAVNDMFSWKPI